MGAVDGNTLLAVAVVTAGFFAGTVVLVLVLLAELGGKFLLNAQSFLPVAFVELLHGSFFNGIAGDNHRKNSLMYDWGYRCAYILAYTSSAIHWSNALSEFFVVKAPLFLSEEEKVRLFSISRSDWVNRLFSPVSSAIRAVKP